MPTERIKQILTLASVAFWLIWGFLSAVSVVPEQRETQNRTCLLLLIASVALSSCAAVACGILRVRDSSVKLGRLRRVVCRVVFWSLLPVGFLSYIMGHAYHHEAVERESQMQTMLERDHYYKNPYYEMSCLCDLGAAACWGGWFLWAWLALIVRIASRVVGKRVVS